VINNASQERSFELRGVNLPPGFQQSEASYIKLSDSLRRRMRVSVVIRIFQAGDGGLRDPHVGRISLCLSPCRVHRDPASGHRRFSHEFFRIDIPPRHLVPKDVSDQKTK
jgi:hypothetical protein